LNNSIKGVPKTPTNKTAKKGVLSIPKIGSEVRARKPIVALKTPKGRLGDIFEFSLKMFKYSQLPIRTNIRYIPNKEYGCR
jgi:hypothetical protein